MNDPRIQCFTHLFSLLLLLLILSLLPLVTSQEVDNEREFNYIEGDPKGPEHWGDIKKEWVMCKKGRRQSPISLPCREVEVVPVSEKIYSFYRPGNATLKNRGHDIAVEWKGENSKIQINGIEYILRQAHWHSPSEHSIDGQRFAMEFHMVHQSRDNKIAVIGLLYDIGRPDPFIEKLTEEIKSISNTSDELEIGIINPQEIEMPGITFYRYMGSLTTPPCTEGILWTVYKQTTTVSIEQVALLREAVHDGARENARPLQSRHGRKVRLYTIRPRGAGYDIL